VRHEVQAARQQVGHLYPRGGVGALVRQGEGECDLVAHGGGRGAHRFQHQQGGLLGGLGGAGAGDGRFWGGWVGGADGRGVGLRGGGGHRGSEAQRRRGAGIDRADRPLPVGAVVAALAGGGRYEVQAARQWVAHLNAGGGIRTIVDEGEGEGD